LDKQDGTSPRSAPLYMQPAYLRRNRAHGQCPMIPGPDVSGHRNCAAEAWFQVYVLWSAPLKYAFACLENHQLRRN